MKPASGLKLAAVALLAVGTIALSLAGLAALNDGGEVRVGPSPVLELATGYDRRAQALLATQAPSADALSQAALLSRRALDQYPYDTSARLRLAYVDRLQAGRLTPDGVAQLRRSYDLVPVDSYVGLWRVRFALENSQQIPADLRAQVRNEVTTLWQEPRRRNELKRMGPTLGNPAGRLSLALWLARLQG